MLVQTECALLPETNFSMHIPVFAKQSSFKNPNLAPRMHTSSRKVMLKLRQIRHVAARKRMRSA